MSTVAKIAIVVWNLPGAVLVEDWWLRTLKTIPEDRDGKTPVLFEDAVKNKVAKHYRINPSSVSITAHGRTLCSSHVVENKGWKPGKRAFPVLTDRDPVLIEVQTIMSMVCAKTVERIVNDEIMSRCGWSTVWKPKQKRALEKAFISMMKALFIHPSD